MMSFEENISKTLAEVDKDVDRLAKGLITELGTTNFLISTLFLFFITLFRCKAR